MALFIKITITDFEHASRDKREISVVEELGHEVEVVAKSKDGLNAIGEHDGYKVHYLSTRLLGKSKYLITLNRLLSVFYWSKYIRKLNATCISGHNLEAAIIGLLSNLFKKNKAILVYDPHEYTLKTKEKSKPSKIYTLIIASLEKFIIKRSAFTITVNNSIAEAMKKDYCLKEKPLVIRNIANFWHIDYYTCELKRKEICDSINVPHDSFLVMYHGAVMKGRGIENLIKSVHLAGSGIAVIILGYGELNYKDELRQLALSIGVPIFFHEAVPVGELWKYIGAVDLGVSLATNSCTNHYFMLPNKIFENIQSMTPILASEFPEIKNIVEGYKIGICCDASDNKNITDSIRRLKNDIELYTNLKENLIIAKNDLCWENEKKSLNKAYKSVLGLV